MYVLAFSYGHVESKPIIQLINNVRVVGVANRLLPQLLLHIRYQLFFVDIFLSSTIKTDRHTSKGREVVQGQVIGSEFPLEEILRADTETKIFQAWA